MIVLAVLSGLYALLVVARGALEVVQVPAHGASASVARAVWTATEPPLGLLRGVVPPLRIGPTAVDPSPLLLVLLLLLVITVTTG